MVVRSVLFRAEDADPVDVFFVSCCLTKQWFPIELHALVVCQTIHCPDGGIGRRAWFRSMCLRVWRFESSSGHQDIISDNIVSNPLNLLSFKGIERFILYHKKPTHTITLMAFLLVLLILLRQHHQITY